MKIILSPAKKMNVDLETLECYGLPSFLEDTKKILEELKSKSPDELKRLWKTNEQLTSVNIARLENMNLESNLTPAILSYEGIAYQYMAPSVLEQSHLDYIQEHLCILSGFYGVLRALDGVSPYRLEMQAKLKVDGCKDLYEFWGRKIYDYVSKESNIIINLASNEYSKIIEPYLRPEDLFITCVFGQIVHGKVVQKGTYAKMARGEMVRYMAINKVRTIEELKAFNHLGYQYSREFSTEKELVFIKV